MPAERVVAAVPEAGITYAELGRAVGVSKDTATRYVKTLGDRLVVVGGGPKQPARVYRSDAALHSAARASAAPPAVGDGVDGERQHRSAARTYIGAAVGAALPTASADDVLTHALRVFGDDLVEPGAVS